MGFPEVETFEGEWIGKGIHGTIAKNKTYKVNRGNGYYGTKVGVRYQKKFNYVVPSSINNPESEPYRVHLKAAVLKWQNGLTDAEKKEYNRRATRRYRMGGYHLFMREAMLGKVDMFVDRGDPAAVDFVDTDLTIDGAWHTLNLSAIIPKVAKSILLKSRVQAGGIGDRIRYRRAGNSNEINTCSCEALRANALRRRMSVVAVNGAQEIEYNADNVAWATLEIIVRGWWT